MTVYYAQNSTVNINSANQWNTAANGSGSFLTWPPAAGDVLMANGKTAITVNVNMTVSEVRTDTANGATAGGGFTLADGVTLTANVYAGTTPCVAFSGVTGFIVGALTGGSSNNAHGANNNSTGTLTITGSCVGGSGGSGVSGAANVSTGAITLIGNATGGSAALSYGVRNISTGTISISGNVTGGSNDSAYGAFNATTGTINVAGNAYGSSTSAAPALYGTHIYGPVNLNGAAYASATGCSPIGGHVRIVPGSGAKLYLRDNSLVETLFIAPDYAINYGSPAQSDVRHGTSYALGALTGTCHVPAAASVVKGVPVDATVGTADLLTAADVRSALGLASANLDAQLDAIPTAAEIWSNGTRTLTTSAGGATAQDVWEYATRSLTEAPDVPTVEEIAAEVRTELTPELSRVANCATVESTGDQLAGLL